MKISVIGLGYVGCVTAACFAEMGHQVIGVDVNPSKVRLINRGVSPIVEDRITDLMREQVKSGSLYATQDIEKAVKQTDIIFISVGTPSSPDGSLDFSFVERACLEIGMALKKTKAYKSIVLRSTVLPGTTENIAIPRLEDYSGKKAGKDFGFALNPEFLREGTAVYDFYHPPKTVIGELDKRTGAIVERIYKEIDARIFRIGLNEASMIKYTDNAFHAIKVTFANEIGRLCKEFNIDSRVVMNVFTKDTKLNLSAMYFRPGFAFGGSCLPKDLRAITCTAKQSDISVPLLDAALQSNLEHIRFAANMVQKDAKARIGILGVSFKEGTDDLRESPVVTLAEKLLDEGYSLSIFDHNVSQAKKNGSNADYLKEKFHHLENTLCDTADDVVSKSDVLVIGNRTKEHEAALKRLKNQHRIVDLSGIEFKKTEDMKEAHYEGICW